ASFKGAARMVAEVSVFEAGSGRTTRGQAAVPVHPERFYLGLSGPSGKVEAGLPIAVNGMVVDWSGKPAAGVEQVSLEFLRLEPEYSWYYDEGEGDESYGSALQAVPRGRA